MTCSFSKPYPKISALRNTCNYFLFEQSTRCISSQAQTILFTFITHICPGKFHNYSSANKTLFFEPQPSIWTYPSVNRQTTEGPIPVIDLEVNIKRHHHQRVHPANILTFAPLQPSSSSPSNTLIFTTIINFVLSAKPHLPLTTQKENPIRCWKPGRFPQTR